MDGIQFTLQFNPMLYLFQNLISPSALLHPPHTPFRTSAVHTTFPFINLADAFIQSNL